MGLLTEGFLSPENHGPLVVTPVTQENDGVVLYDIKDKGLTRFEDVKVGDFLLTNIGYREVGHVVKPEAPVTAEDFWTDGYDIPAK